MRDNNKIKLPKDEIKEKQAEAKRKAEKLKADFKEVFSSPKGENVLRAIKDQCGFNTTSISFPDGRVCAENVLVAEGARLVWIKLRPMIDESILKKIE